MLRGSKLACRELGSLTNQVAENEVHVMRRIYSMCILFFGLVLSSSVVCAEHFYIIPVKRGANAAVEKTGQTTSHETADVFRKVSRGRIHVSRTRMGFWALVDSPTDPWRATGAWRM